MIALTVALVRLQRRVDALERRGHPLPDVVPHQPPPPVPVADIAPPPAPAPPRRRPALPRPSRPAIDFETLVGSRLPVWIGGLALVIGGIFLVRLSIEAGWLTPAIRTVLAALFALALLIGSEAARGFAATRDDPRIAQVLAGAGIASAYATLYLAAALYHLIGPATGFAIMLGVTALGLFLALRHGPPTAVMALVGGFAAPLVAGYDAAGIGALLVYLGLFVVALLALAIVRGWAWLALSALVAAFGWVGLLIALVPPASLGGIAVFLIVLAIGGSLATPRAAIARPWLRAAPLLAALVQMLALAPMLDFSVLAWSFYLTLSVAALVLAWRDAILLPAAIVTAILVTLLTGAGMVQDDGNATEAMVPVAMLIFAGAGAALSRRGAGWGAVALLGSIGPLLAAQLCTPWIARPIPWLLLALAGGALAWRHRDRVERGDVGLVGGIATVALAVGILLATYLPAPWIALAPLAAGGILLAALRLDRRAIGRLVVLPWLLLLLAAAGPIAQILVALGKSLGFDVFPYAYLPRAVDAAALILLPGIAVLAAAWRAPALFGPLRRLILPVQIALTVLGGYVLLKQPFAIATLPAFTANGFIERALLTDLSLLIGALAGRRHRRLGAAFLILGLARLVWYDLLGLNPVWIAQNVGPLPLLNAATLHLGFAAALIWRWTDLPRRSLIAALLTLVATLATIRQIAHGTLLTGPIGLAENGGYSAAMLALATLWLWRGIARASADLRRFGLTLLTLTTLKVFLIDAAALEGVLRILSFMALGGALIGIGWAYRRYVVAAPARSPSPPPMQDTVVGGGEGSVGSIMPPA
ncbi:hypothetical protein ASE65_12180 [Sphingomonas sp. Leaf16]|nr:hypothetical protein ASE65_12180 [Sphingomonas sp. Leaf16]KQN12801.1 hypothetical protein ASE81_05625 [Sphingomonas sp. Leaf29]KQN19689.1 hypothetical protein ASE83_05555 [Sphingomonas sp. Leaf32]